MRSWSSPPNHSSPWRVTQTLEAAWAGRPSLSEAVTISSTSPGCDSWASHCTMPWASLLPVHTVPMDWSAVWLS